MEKYGDDVDPETIVSMYIPHRRPKRIGAALLRMDKIHIILMGMMTLVAVLFLIAFSQEKMGNFTINLNRLELYRRGIAISNSGDFENATARLTASAVKDATNISIEDLPKNLDKKEGSHNGKNYMAYTYYVRNAGKEDLDYIARITMDSAAKGAEDAVRVAVWKMLVTMKMQLPDGVVLKAVLPHKQFIIHMYMEPHILIKMERTG